MAVGRTRHARVAHLDTSRRDVAFYVAEMDEYAFAVMTAAAAGGGTTAETRWVRK